ncbi:MAG TPA: winged helix-turn-helix domain-containing protein [Streptosporangiaceae bacterium]|nr:winged helix-turn-helix domain-containing protein [Streptosporangiaceae bacterium]
MAAELCLDLPWVPQSVQQVGELAVRRARRNVLSYDDGIALEVCLLDPAAYPSAEALVGDAEEQAQPGRVVLVAGMVPVSWRSQLREAELSFIDVSGVADISWPRLRIVARHFAQPVRRQRSPVPLQKGHARVVQELLIVSGGGAEPALAYLAEGAKVSLSTASRAITQLAEHGLVVKKRSGSHVVVAVTDRVEIAERLAAQTAWPGGQRIGGYLWGRNGWDVAARLSANAIEAGITLAVTGRAGAAFLGVLGTSSPSEVRCWVDAGERPLTDIAGSLGLDPAPEEAANVTLSSDPWRVGVHRRGSISFEDWTATVAHPVRVWCDLHSEKRGVEFAAQLWGAVTHAR